MRLPSARAAVLLLLLPRLAQADLKSAEDKFLHGDYPGAIKDFKAVKGKDAARAGVRLGHVQLRTGDLAAAEAGARAGRKAADQKVAADAGVLLGEVLRAAGRYADARKVLEDVGKADPAHLRARALLATVYEDLGQRDLADPLWNLFYDDWSDGKIDQNDGAQLMYVAMAARGIGNFKDANDTFQDAVAAAPTLLEANVAWGNLFMEKYAAGEAEQSYLEVLKTDPNHPAALAGMARVKIEQAYDVAGAAEYVQKALAVNPRFAGALEVRAVLEIDNEQHADAEKTIAEMLAVNPNDLAARSMRAAIHWLEDDLATYEAEKKKVLAVNPRYAPFFHIVGDFAVKEHRYRAAIKLEEEAIALDPKYYTSLAAIGLGYLRLGEEPKGLEYLNKAWAEDRFNVRTFNTLNLYEDTIPKDYEFVASKHFKLRVPRDERATLERYVPRTLEAAIADMTRRYGFTPTLPVTIELYADPQHYSVRTVGLPNLGALGVCFGQVITALSPSNGNVNWGMVLWHELGHVFAIQLSNNRVPRWFTEGLSEYETVIARPEWRRENDVDVWTALAAGSLPSVADLNTRFTRAKDMQEIVVAYHMSSVTIEFLATRWGFPRIVEALKLYGQGKATPAVLKAVTGLDVPAFDAELRRYLEKRLAGYKGTFKVQLGAYGDLTAREKAAAAKPGDAEAQADLAVAYLAAEDGDKAAAAAVRALGLDARNRKALWVQAALAFAKNDRAAAKDRIAALIAAGGDGYDARLRLGEIAIDEKDAKAAERELNLAKKLDPERSEPYALLADLFFKNGRDDDGLKELERYAYIEQMEYGPVKKLVDKYSSRQTWAKVKEFGEMALLINPYDADLHVAVGEAYLGLGKNDDAVWELESALAANPGLRRPAVAHVGLARAHLARKDDKKARKAVAEALKLEPQNAQALALKKKLPR